MPFVVEVLKQHDKEIYRNETQTTRNAGADSTWGNLLTVNEALKLSKPSLVIVKCQFYAKHSQHTNVCCQESCIRIGFKNTATGEAYYCGSYGWSTYNTTGEYTYDFQGFIVLDAGTYDLIVDTSEYDCSYVGPEGFNNLYVGTVDLADLFKIINQKETHTVNSGARLEFGEVTIPPLTRTTSIGPLKNATVFIFIGVENKWWYGDCASSNCIGFQAYLDGEWITSPTRKFTSETYNTAAFHWAQIYKVIDPNVSHTVKFRFSNGTSSSQTATAHYGIIACPWIIPQDNYYNLINIEVPVGSTIYGAIEDMFMPANSKYAAIRSTNVINGEQNVSEFSQNPGETSPLNFNYTPEWYETEIKLGVKGLWNCVSRLAVDLRG